MNKIIKNGDRLRVIKPFGKVVTEKDIGKICTVISHIEDNIHFKFENGVYGWIADHLVTRYFEILKPYKIGDLAKVVRNIKDMTLAIDSEYLIEDIKYGVITLIPMSDDDHGIYFVSNNVFEECFELLEPQIEKECKEKQQEEVFSLTPDNIDEIMDNCELEVSTVFGKCTIVACKLPNGFVLVESSACVDPINYDEHIGLEICLNKIRDKVWELEGYKLQQKMYDTTSQKTNLHLVQPCTCNEDCDLCKPKQKFCPYHCDGNCDNCSRIKGE